MHLPGLRVLVTGASSGIGRATSLALAARGCTLVLTGRDAQRLADVARATGGDALPADLRRTEDVAALVKALSGGPALDVMVLNAGVGLRASALEHSDGDVESLLALNLRAPMHLSRALAPAMVHRRAGRLVFVTSVAGLLGVPEEAAYAASKGALGAYAASLRGELAGTGVGVTTVIPGVVDTAFFRRRGRPYDRRLPRPIRAERVATATVRALEADREAVVVPGWLRIPIALQGVAPQTFARLAARWG